MRERVHIFGASGSGTSRLGREIAARHRVPYFDADDFFWLPTNPPYRHVRERSARQRLLMDALSERRWVLAGSICGWGDAAAERFDLAVFVVTATDIRLARLRAREMDRYGDRILETGDMYEQHHAFMAWAAQYDEGTLDMRSRRLHDEWLSRLSCRVVRVDGSVPIDTLADQVSAAMAT